MDDIIDINTLFGPLPVASSDLSVDTLLQLMQKHKVGTACILSTLGLLLDPTVGNAATRAACGEHPELLPIATLNPTMYFGDSEPILRLKADKAKTSNILMELNLDGEHFLYINRTWFDVIGSVLPLHITTWSLTLVSLQLRS